MLYLQPHQFGATTVQLKPTTFAPHLGLSIQHDLLRSPQISYWLFYQYVEKIPNHVPQYIHLVYLYSMSIWGLAGITPNSTSAAVCSLHLGLMGIESERSVARLHPDNETQIHVNNKYLIISHSFFVVDMYRNSEDFWDLQ